MRHPATTLTMRQTALWLISSTLLIGACGDVPGPPTDIADTALPDTALPDANEPDTTPTDSHEPDTAENDTIQPDTHEPDTAQPDTAENDTTETDAALPDDGTDALLAEPLPDGACRTRYEHTSAGSFAPLCALHGPIRHVRIDRFAVAPGHASAQLVIGGDEIPTATSGDVGEGRFRLLAYGFTPGSIYTAIRDGGTGAETETALSFQQPQTICMDLLPGITDGSSTALIWIDGQDDADCRDPSTLTSDRAVLRRDTRGDTPARFEDGGAWFYQGVIPDSRPVITLFDTPQSACETEFSLTTDWQPLCVPTAGLGHVRVEGVRAEGTNRYMYVVIGESSPSPEGNPSAAEGTGTLVWHSGATNTGASTNWTSFDGQNTGMSAIRDNFQNDEGQALYTEADATICAEIWQDDDPQAPAAMFRMWASGALGADCHDPSTLEPARALRTLRLEGSLSRDGGHWLKVNNTAISADKVVVMATGGPAARDADTD